MQIKDMVLKLKGADKSGLKSSTNSEGVQYPYMGGLGSGSTPLWDANLAGGRSDQGFIGGTSGNTTPRVQEPVVAVVEEVDGNKEWVAQVEPGVDVTFVSLPDGGNDLRRIRFNRDMFDKWQAQVWWGENFDRLRELYNVQTFNRQALNNITPPPSEDEQRDSAAYWRLHTGGDIPMAGWFNDSAERNQYYNPARFTMGQGSSSQQQIHAAGSSMEASRTSSKDELSFSNASEIESEWLEQVEPGVFVTIRQLPDGSKEIRRIRFSRQRFGDEEARKWWEDNRERVNAEFL
ncbi:hypothetical protein L195_g016333 [Trifolium pratense]|uniref:Brevis RADIX-like protein n=3 Tax=Trifolium pratense TaxID=57577 RepID=A0A2K3MR03_TRIPR|nr:brevis RADIX-like protein [Trifolium pratense]PNX93182.1 hypothetical protein L195_g016333 [Trifolium pratense]